MKTKILYFLFCIITCSFAGLVNAGTISGRIFNDPNSADGIGGTGTNAGGSLYAVLVRGLFSAEANFQTSGIVIANTQVAADGSYSFTTAVAGQYSIYLSTTPLSTTSPGYNQAASSLPTGWQSSGETVDGTNLDAAVNTMAQYLTVTGSSSATQVNFGIYQPAANNSLCATNLLVEKITPTTNFYDFNGAAADGNVAINSISPATPTGDPTTGLGWQGAQVTGNNSTTILAASGYTAFNREIVAQDFKQTMTRPLTNANPAGTGAVISLSIAARNGLQADGYAPSRTAVFSIIYNNVVYATISTPDGSGTVATLTPQNGASVSVAGGTTEVNTTTFAMNANGSTVTFTNIALNLPASVANSGDLVLQYFIPATGQYDAPGTTGFVNNAGDDYFLQSVSFKSCPPPVKGTVYNDNDATTGGANGTPLSGVTVTLYAADGTTVIATTTTDASGNYTFNNIANGNYVVGVTPPNGFSNVSSTDGSPLDGKTAVTMSDVAIIGVNFGVNQPPASSNDGISGQTPGSSATVPNILFNDTDPNSGTLSPANINLVTPAGATGITSSGGNVTGFTVPGQGTWVLNTSTGAVTFTPQAGFTGDPTPINYTVKDAAGLTSNQATITIDYNPPVTVSGTVLNDNNGTTDGVNGTPMIGTTVTLYAADGTTVVATTITDASGNYSFPNQVPGNYVIGVTPPAGYQHVSSTDASPTDGKTTVTVGNTAVTGVNLGLNQPPTAANDGITGQTPGNAAIVPNILSNDSDPNGGALSPANISLVTPAGATGITTSGGNVTGFIVPGQGTWALNTTTGALTFTPSIGFTADPTPINYTVKDAAGLTSNQVTVIIDYSIPLPVNLVRFEAIVQANCQATLYWLSAEEMLFSRYEVEYSMDGKSFEPVGSIAATGDHSSYSFTYPATNDGKHYFRLKLLDRDGAYTYSKTITASLHCGKKIIVYPTVTSDLINISGLEGKETIKLYDSRGSLLTERTAGTITEQLNLSRFAQGTYYMVIVTASGEQLSFRLIKNN